jgi:hypothetical protein
MLNVTNDTRVDSAAQETSAHPERINFLDLKPYLSGTSWRLSGAGGTWTEELLAYVRAFDQTLHAGSDYLVRMLTGVAIENDGDKLAVPAVLCRQRQIGPLINESDFVTNLDELTGDDLREHPHGVMLCGFAYRLSRVPSWAKSRSSEDGWNLTGSRWDLLQVTFAWPPNVRSTGGQ